VRQFYKKPYNPVLGEVHDTWTVSSKYGETHAVLEQVSHHPPVTAATIWNEQCQVRMLGNYSFQVKFYTNSAAVTCSGCLELVFGRHDEVYTCPTSMPALTVGRVIWGTRSMLWSGDVPISCARSGLHLLMRLKTHAKKEQNVFEALVTHQSDPARVLARLEGEPLGMLTIEREGQPGRQPFLDLGQLPPAKCLYPPLDRLPPNASLRVWAETNRYIVADDMDKADIAKKSVEDAQRARRRAQADQEHTAALFYWDENRKQWRPKENLQPPRV
jgi:hypothetical protein